jgi:hypothetical protein
MKTTIPTLSLLTLLASGPVGAAAQLPQASATALGMGFNMTASARGFAAVANNPAGLGHPSSPGFSMAIPGVFLNIGLGPVSFGDVAEWEQRVLPDAVKAEWLARISDANGLVADEGAGATFLALSVGPVGLQVSLGGGARATLAPAVAELLLYGNAGRTGDPGDFTFQGSEVDAFALSTVAVSYGVRVSPTVYVGTTGKYTMGNGLLTGRDAGSFADADPLSVEISFPRVMTSFEDDAIRFDQGSGVGVDVGALWEGSTVTLGATVQNVVNTFAWTLDHMEYRPGEAVLTQGSSTSDFDARPGSAAPQGMLDVVGDLTLKPVFSAGAEWRPNELWQLQADVRKRASGGLGLGPDFHSGVGAELGAISFLPLRAHAAVVSGGAQFGGGASLVLGPVNLSGAGAVRTGESAGLLAMFTLSFGAN